MAAMLRRAAMFVLALAMLASTGGVATAGLSASAALTCCSTSCPAPARNSRDAARCCRVAPHDAVTASAKASVKEPGAQRHVSASWFAVLTPVRRIAVTMIARDESPPAESPSPSRLCSFQI
ncbi:MAG TPA: hypothetical protein VMV13_09975 [Candidatus Binataceae bacterium]|nr:hypothetical protein [Candidatus Binataceae bacterium]